MASYLDHPSLDHVDEGKSHSVRRVSTLSISV